MPNPKGNASTLKPYKPKWRSGPTQTIRVPIALTNRLMEIAKRLDSNGSVLESQSVDLDSAMEQILNDPIVTRKNRDRWAIKRGFDALKTRLK